MSLNTHLSPALVLRYLDDLRLETLPLPAHFARSKEESVREPYARLLAVVLLCEPVIAESQRRLFRMLLGALGVAEQESQILEAAQEVDRAFLRDCAGLFAESGLSRSFMTDAVILLRMAGALSNAQQTLLSELAHVFHLNQPELRTIADIAAVVLGRPADEKTYDAVEIQEFIVWKEFLGTELTAERLAQGLGNGIWRITSVIEMTSDWSVRDATLLFLPGGRIVTTSDSKHRADVVIRNTALDGPIMTFDGINVLELKDCDITGHYQQSDLHTAFTITRSDGALFNNCSFTTVDARALSLTHTPAVIQKCHFHECGNVSMPGGAIALRRLKASREVTLWEGSDFSVSGSRFIDCTASIGGAIRADGLQEAVEGCRFENCSSAGLDERSQHIGLFFDYAGTDTITDSTIRGTDVYLGNLSRSNTFSAVVRGSRLVNCDAFYHGKHQNLMILSLCNLDASRSVNLELTAENWWFDY